MEDADVDHPLVVVFLRELTEQHNFAQTAYQGMRDKFEKVFAQNREMNPDAARSFWFFSQAFLSAPTFRRFSFRLTAATRRGG
jgi:hypothetical protein